MNSNNYYYYYYTTTTTTITTTTTTTTTTSVCAKITDNLATLRSELFQSVTATRSQHFML